MKGNTVEWINTLGAFCGVRDVPTLTKDALEQKYGFRQADVMVLFGGSILCGGNVLAEAMKNQAAKKYVIVGGASAARLPVFRSTKLSKMQSSILLSFVDFAANFLACFSSLFLKRVFDDGPRWNVLRQAV